MSVLIIGLEAELARTLIGRLVAQGDEVRVIAAEGDDAEALRSLGAHIARGPFLDADLVERAAQSVRTIVVGVVQAGMMNEILEGARAARVDRIVLCTPGPAAEQVGLLSASPGEYVVLTYPRPRWPRRSRVLAPESVATAVDAADDLAGEPRLELDLNEASSWDALGVEARIN